MDIKVKHLIILDEVINNTCPFNYGIYCTEDCHSNPIYNCMLCWEKSLELEKDKENLIIRVED